MQVMRPPGTEAHYYSQTPTQERKHSLSHTHIHTYTEGIAIFLFKKGKIPALLRKMNFPLIADMGDDIDGCQVTEMKIILANPRCEKLLRLQSRSFTTVPLSKTLMAAAEIGRISNKKNTESKVQRMNLSVRFNCEILFPIA